MFALEKCFRDTKISEFLWNPIGFMKSYVWKQNMLPKFWILEMIGKV